MVKKDILWSFWAAQEIIGIIVVSFVMPIMNLIEPFSKMEEVTEHRSGITITTTKSVLKIPDILLVLFFVICLINFLLLFTIFVVDCDAFNWSNDPPSDTFVILFIGSIIVYIVPFILIVILLAIIILIEHTYLGLRSVFRNIYPSFEENSNAIAVLILSITTLAGLIFGMRKVHSYIDVSISFGKGDEKSEN